MKKITKKSKVHEIGAQLLESLWRRTVSTVWGGQPATSKRTLSGRAPKSSITQCRLGLFVECAFFNRTQYIYIYIYTINKMSNVHCSIYSKTFTFLNSALLIWGFIGNRKYANVQRRTFWNIQCRPCGVRGCVWLFLLYSVWDIPGFQKNEHHEQWKCTHWKLIKILLSDFPSTSVSGK